MAQNCLCVRPKALRKVLNRMVDVVGVKSRISDGTDLFLICKDRECGVLRVLRSDLRHQRCIRAHTVILSVGTDETTVQSDINGLVCRNHLDLRTGEILLCDSVAVIQQLHRKELRRILDLLVLLVMVRDGADDDVQLLAL